VDDIDHSDFVEYGKKIDNLGLEKILFMFMNLPDGVQAMSENIDGLVETSLNMGIMKQSKKEMVMEFAVRSSVGISKKTLMEQLEKITQSQDGHCEITGEYPAWEYRKNSPLRDKMVAVYQEIYGKKPELMAIHAGLECGILAGKIQNMDGVSFGPDMKDIHTAEERLSISSTKRTWDYILKILSTK
jgi:dipeptidase D